MSDYSWTITGGTGTSTSNTIDVTWNNTPGSSHSVSVSYTDGNGCTETATLDVTVEVMVQNTTTGTYYCTIQDAIDAASAGDNILLLTDISEDIVTIDKALTLDGGNFKLTSTSATYGILVSGIENVTIKNITVDNPETYESR
jgi:dihydroxyacetone kinase DhaKLM complex PTS-EIIA-like component DhaM